MAENNMTVPELIQGFENDIQFDCHSFALRYGRSNAGKEILRRGRSILPEIDEHLRRNPPSDQYQIETAWVNLRGEIESTT